MAGATRKLTVEILGEAKGLKGAAGEAEQAVGRLDGGFSKLKTGALAVGAGLVGVGVAAMGMVNAAVEDEKAAASLAKTLSNVTGATKEQIAANEAWITKTMFATGVADDQLRPALDTLVRGTKDVGEAQKLMGLALDISAGTGKDATAVAEALAKAYNGQLGPLKKLDPALADLVKSGASADEVMAALGKTFEGQAAAAADTTAGRVEIAKLRFGELQEEIGAKLIPVLSGLADFAVTTLIPAIESVVAWVTEHWPEFQAAIETGIAAITDAWNTYGAPVLEAIIGAVSGFIEIVQGAWSIFGDTILTNVSDTWGNIKTLIGGALDLITGIWNTFKGLFTGDWGLMWDGIKQTLSGAWELIKGIVSTALDGIKLAISLAWDAIGAVAGEAWDRIKGGISGAWDGITSAISGKIDDIKSTVSGGIDEVVGFFTGLPGRITDTIGDIGAAALSIGKEVIKKLGEGISGVVGFSSDIAAAVSKAVKGAINAVIDKVNSAFEFKIPVPFGPDIHVDPPDIPKLHTGGVFRARRGTEGLALLQDGETVFQPDQLAALAAAGFDRGPASNVVNLYVNVNVPPTVSDPAEVGRHVAESLASFVRLNGVPTWLVEELAAA